MLKVSLLGLVLPLMFSNVVLAYNGGELSTSVRAKESRNFSIVAEGDAVLNSGAGIKGAYKLNDKLALGVFAKSFNLKSDSDYETTTANSYKHKMTIFGGSATYFPTSAFDQQGLYLSGGVSSANVETTVSNEYVGQGSSKASKVGVEGKIGYQFVNRINSTLGMLFQVGAGYGNGGGVRWRAFTGANTQIEDSILFDLNAGLQF